MSYHKVDKLQRKQILQQLTMRLKGIPEALFAYVHGSFIQRELFRDVDIAIFLEASTELTSPLDYELDLEVRLRWEFGFPVDVRLLNQAPVVFCFCVIKEGLLLFSKDEGARSNFEGYVFSAYADFAPFRARYFKEVLGVEI